MLGWLRWFLARNGVALFENEWKLVRLSTGEAPMLYNVLDDPSENSDLAPTSQTRVEQMLETIAERTAAVADQLN